MSSFGGSVPHAIGNVNCAFQSIGSGVINTPVSLACNVLPNAFVGDQYRASHIVIPFKNYDCQIIKSIYLGLADFYSFLDASVGGKSSALYFYLSVFFTPHIESLVHSTIHPITAKCFRDKYLSVI